MLTPDQIARLIALGLSPEQLASVVEILAEAKSRMLKNARQRRWRASKRLPQASTSRLQASTQRLPQASTSVSRDAWVPPLGPLLPLPGPSPSTPIIPSSGVGRASQSAAPNGQGNGHSKPRKLATRFPEDWHPTSDLLDMAIKEGLSRDEIRREFNKFADYWRGVSGAKGTKLDWNATWRNWMRRA